MGVVQVDGASLAYGSHEVLAGVSLRAEPGTVVAVTGPSGSGKTSLLRALAGLLTPRTGAVTVGGVAVTSREQAAAAGVVLVPQGNRLAPVLTARENIQVALLAAGVSVDEASERAQDALDRVGLADAAEQLVEELSGGQQQRATFARGLARAGSVFLVDEATSELDAGNRQRVVGLLRQEAERGRTVVFATHDPEAAAECDAEVRLSDGTATLVRTGRAEMPTGGYGAGMAAPTGPQPLDLPFDPIERAGEIWERRWGPASAMRVATSVMRVQQILLARYDAVLRRHELTFARYEALVLLRFSRAGALPLKVIGERLMVHPTSVTNTVDRLVTAGLVERRPNPADGRGVLAALTVRGVEVVEAATADLTAIDFGLASVDEDARAELFTGLRQIRLAAGDFS